jgi:hypothetical protein
MSRSNYKTGGAGIDPFVVIVCILFAFLLGGGYWYKNVYTSTPASAGVGTTVITPPAAAAVVVPPADAGVVPPADAGVVPPALPLVVPPAGTVIPTCTHLEDLINGKCLALCPDGEERIGEKCYIKCADGKIRDGIACKNDPKLLKAMQARLADYIPKKLMGLGYGGVGDSSSTLGAKFDFKCDSTLDDYISEITGRFDSQGPTGLRFKCKSGDVSSMYGLNNYGTTHTITAPSGVGNSFNKISGKGGSWVDRLDIYGGDGGEFMEEVCEGNAIIRGVTGLHGNRIGQIGFKCA